MLIVAVPVTVKFVDVAVVQAVPLPPIVQVADPPVPKAKILTLLFVELNPLLLSDTAYPLASKVPAVRFKIPPDAPVKLIASCSVTDPPGVLMTMKQANDLPELVSVWLPRPAKVIVPVPVLLFDAEPLIQLP